MSTRRGSRDKRCPRCFVHQDNCFCDEVQVQKLKTKLSIILFKKERFLPSNTAQLSLNSLSNSECFVRGIPDVKMSESLIDKENYQPLILFPTEDSVPLSSDLIKRFDKPINLIVPDGTWRQAKKVHKREPLLDGILQVRLEINQKSEYLLRRQKYEFGLCTHEAIAYAFGIIEDKSVQEILLKNFQSFQQAHLKNRDIYSKE